MTASKLPAPNDQTVLVVAPVGRDGKLIQQALATAEVRAEVLGSIAEVVEVVVREAVGALLVTEEVLDEETVGLLARCLAGQPAWSDLPVVLLTIGGAITPLSRQRERERLPLGSVTLLERPIRMATLISSIRAALRSRSRQYLVRDTLLERDRAEASLKESESRLRLAVETARLGSWELDPATGILKASPTCRKSFDWEAEEPLKAEDLLGRVHPEDRPIVEEELRQALEAGSHYAGEFRVVWRDGGVRWISANARVLVSRTAPAAAPWDAVLPPRMFAVVLDITDRVLAESAIRDADKLALVGRLASSIAHEINNPLESVTNLLYLLGTADLPEPERDYVRMAQAELARVSEIAAQTLSFNRQQNTFGEAVLTAVLDSVLTLYGGRLATSRITVKRDYRYARAIRCYPGELRQVFTNLIGNAFDATRQGGVIRVRERLIAHPVSGKKGIRISVADTGVGMTPEVLNHLFEAFYSTKGNNGTGLGLWISKQIAEKHGGSLRVSSSQRPGHPGTVFTVFLPLR